MTATPITVDQADSVVYVAKVLSEHRINGLPVVDKENNLLGIVTEYDLISSSNSLHLPTLINVLGNINVYKKDKSLIKDDLKKLLSLQVKDVMNREPLSVDQNTSIQELSDLFAHHHRVNPITVVNGTKLVGVVSRFDLVKFFVDEKAHKDVRIIQPENLDARVETFVNDFEKRFVLVSRARTRFLWPIIGFTFAVLGFIVAFALILRIVTK